MIAPDVIRRIADEVIAQITMGCKAYRDHDSLNGELHLSLANVALLKLQRLLDAPPVKPFRKMALVHLPPGEEVSPAVDDERWDRVPIPDWAHSKKGGPDGSAA